MSAIFKNLPDDGFVECDESQWPWRGAIKEDFHVIVYEDKYPVTTGHLLFVPRYNSTGVLEDAISDAIEWGQREVNAGNWDGYNIGINMGKAAGQTCPWPHVHLIPRRIGDMVDPTGGVRHVIPENGNYKVSPKYKRFDLNTINQALGGYDHTHHDADSEGC